MKRRGLEEKGNGKPCLLMMRLVTTKFIADVFAFAEYLLYGAAVQRCQYSHVFRGEAPVARQAVRQNMSLCLCSSLAGQIDFCTL